MMRSVLNYYCSQQRLITNTLATRKIHKPRQYLWSIITFPPVLQAVVGDGGYDLIAGREEICVGVSGEVGQWVLEPYHVSVAHEQLVPERQERVDEQHLLPAHLVEGGGAPPGVLGDHPAAHVEDGHAPEVELPEQLGVHGTDEEVVYAEVGEVANPGEDEVEKGVVAEGDDDHTVAGAGGDHIAGEAKRARRGHPRPPGRGLPDGAVVHGFSLGESGRGEVGPSDGRGGEGERGRGERGEGGEQEEEGGDREAAEDGPVDPDEDRLGGLGRAPRRHFAGGDRGRRRAEAEAGSAGGGRGHSAQAVRGQGPRGSRWAVGAQWVRSDGRVVACTV